MPDNPRHAPTPPSAVLLLRIQGTEIRGHADDGRLSVVFEHQGSPGGGSTEVELPPAAHPSVLQERTPSGTMLAVLVCNASATRVVALFGPLWKRSVEAKPLPLGAEGTIAAFVVPRLARRTRFTLLDRDGNVIATTRTKARPNRIITASRRASQPHRTSPYRRP